MVLKREWPSRPLPRPSSRTDTQTDQIPNQYRCSWRFGVAPALTGANDVTSINNTINGDVGLRSGARNQTGDCQCDYFLLHLNLLWVLGSAVRLTGLPSFTLSDAKLDELWQTGVARATAQD